ncbi:MAG TPA: hypothetical protein VL418_00170 [Devosiaceae bacterium]|jgi:hypothetical protein|nr:hypothetical protein [Devosiaceae bacterium]
MIFLTTQPLWLAGFCLVVLPTLLCMAGPIVIRRYVALDQLRTNNEVAGFTFATVGVLYAVLLAFAVIVVWEKFSESENTVAQEAGAAASLYRLADGIGRPPGATLHDRLTAYLNGAINEEWPAMAHGAASPAVTLALNDLYQPILAFSPVDARDSELLSETVRQLDLLTQSRRARLVVASGIVPGVLWIVLFGGAIVTIGFTFFFGTRNVLAQALMTGALSLLIWSGLLIIVAIDHPFAGSIRVSPEALAAVVEDFSK